MFWMCICSLRYPAFNAHAPYYMAHFFSHCLINGTILGIKIMEHKMRFFYLLHKFSRNISYSTTYSKCTGCTQKNGAVSKVNKKFISHLTLAQRTSSAAARVQVSQALTAVRFSCLLRGRQANFQDGVAARKGFLCAPFWGVQICDYSAAWVSCTV